MADCNTYHLQHHQVSQELTTLASRNLFVMLLQVPAILYIQDESIYCSSLHMLLSIANTFLLIIL